MMDMKEAQSLISRNRYYNICSVVVLGVCFYGDQPNAVRLSLRFFVKIGNRQSGESNAMLVELVLVEFGGARDFMI